MFSNKRNGETFFHDNKDDEEFQIKKKNRLMSMDTSDTSPLRESIFGLIPQKDSSMHSINSFEHSKLETCTEFSFSSPIDHGKKNHFPSAYLHSNSELLKKFLKELSSYEDKFTVIKYNNHKYRLHTALLVKNEMNNVHICKLIRIIRPIKVNSNKILAFLEVEW